MADQSRNAWILKDDPRLVSSRHKDFYEDILEDRRTTSDFGYALRHRDVPVYKYNKERSPADIREHVMKSDRVKYAVEKVTEESGLPLSEVLTQAEEILDEMSHNLRMGVIRGFAIVLTKVLKQLFQRIYVNEEGVQKVREMLKEYPILLMPSHRSYLDFLLMSYVFYHYDLPLPVIAAAMDFMGMKFFGWLLRNSGAFYIRRSFGDDQLYWAVFTEYVQTHICNGDSPIEFYVEGTRSRTQKSLAPKFGMLSASLEPYFKAHVPDLMIIPVSISYDRVLEEKLYAYELLGVPKPKESASGVFKARSILEEDFGNVHVCFGDPVSIRNYSVGLIDRTAHGTAPRYIASLTFQEQALIQKLGYDIVLHHLRNMAISPWSIISAVLLQKMEGIHLMKLGWSKFKGDADDNFKYIASLTFQEQALIQKLGYDIVLHHLRNMAISPWSIISAVLLQNMEGIHLKQLIKEVECLKRQASNLGAYIDWPVNESAEAVMRHNIFTHKNIACVTADNIVELVTDDVTAGQDRDKLMTSAAQELMVCLYRNQLMNVFVRVALVSISINACAQDTLSVSECKSQYCLLQKLLDKEFIFLPGQADQDFEMALLSLTHTCGVVVIDEQIQIKKSINRYTTFFSKMFEPFLMGYWVMCRYLLSMQEGSHGKPLVKLPKAITKEAQMLSAQLLRDGRLKQMEILSLDMMSNSLHALYSLGAVNKEKRAGSSYMYPNLVVLSKVTEDIGKFIDTPALPQTTLNVETKTVVVNAKL